METLVTRLEEVGEYLGIGEEGFVNLGTVEKLERVLGAFLSREEELERQIQQGNFEGKGEQNERDFGDREELIKKINELEVKNYLSY